MFCYTPSGIKFKVFVKESNSDKPSEKPNTNPKYFPVAPLTGDKAKEFYEDILQQPSSSSSAVKKPHAVPQPKPISKPVPKPPIQKKYKNSDLLSMAQNNDVKGLTSFFSQPDFDVNVVDDFGWTALMCASCSGAEEAVEMLLENGADVNKCDRLGNTALKLAKQKHQKRVVEMLENWKKESEPEDGEEEAEDSPEPFFCQTCKEMFRLNKHKHESSTLHLFNCPTKTCTFYGIPESNKGFQLLLREGWDKERGLGPDGKGRKFPVKAVMKKDRTGIGAPPLPEKSKRDGHHTEKYESKKKRLYKEWKDKNFEKKFRLEFS